MQLYPRREKFEEAAQYFESIGSKCVKDKNTKRRAYHNLGNTFIEKWKVYQEGVEAYKRALINSAKDERTRYTTLTSKQNYKNIQQQEERKKTTEKKDEDQKSEEKQTSKRSKDQENRRASTTGTRTEREEQHREQEASQQKKRMMSKVKCWRYAR